MQNKHLGVIYTFRRCPYAIRARLAIWLSGLQLELREVVLRNKPAALLAASPKGTVPVLVLNTGKVIEQSLEIMLWALQQSDPRRCLALDLDAQLQFITEHDLHFKPLLDRYKYPERHPEASSSEHRYNAMYWLENYLNKRLERYTHLWGEQYALVDLAIVPFVRQFALVDMDWFMQNAPKPLINWLDSLTNSVMFESVMEKYPPWAVENNPTLFGRADPL
ncbi:glutathione S-transferase [Chitinibacter bivalviorum]|uniref:Glutathione S-transferase n=1 Tax=Chitinibacter bivalviorum TaxID=2739434 RepID=A0A7H9BMJ9_9NEIS|nr:glutathione S-transferase [Chitinibacter bivalviorum]QLG89863.1 glutathione S-transferase [Chitinibacter bivalviorum]